MWKGRSLKYSVIVLLAVCILNTLTYANLIYDFHIFNNPQYENDPRLEFTLTLTDEGLTGTGSKKIGFRFDNNSDISSSITDIYFDARPDTGSSLLFSNVSISHSSGVSFSKSAYPTTLPDGYKLTPQFDSYPEYSADSDLPVSLNGINPDEWLKLIFTLKSGRTIDNVIAEIANGGTYRQPSLRFGIYIQSLPKDNHYCHTNYSNSASAINCTQPIPEPASAAILALGMFLIASKRK